MSFDLDFSDLHSYIESIARRVSSLEEGMAESAEAFEAKAQAVNAFRNEFASEQESFKERAELLGRELEELSEKVLLLVTQFKALTRKESFQRLQRKVDEWSPEKIATHEDLRRNLEKLLRKR